MNEFRCINDRSARQQINFAISLMGLPNGEWGVYKYNLKQDNCDIVCGYEAGCLGYSLYKQLTEAGIKCIILAPTTMLTQQGKRVKTDARDAELIAKCLSTGTYHAVHIPTKEDEQVRDFLRMRTDQNLHFKKTKQQILAFCLRHGLHYERTN